MKRRKKIDQLNHRTAEIKIFLETKTFLCSQQDSRLCEYLKPKIKMNLILSALPATASVPVQNIH